MRTAAAFLVALMLAGCSSATAPTPQIVYVTPPPDVTSGPVSWPDDYWIGVCGAIFGMGNMVDDFNALGHAEDMTQAELEALAQRIIDTSDGATGELARAEAAAWKPGSSVLVYLSAAAGHYSRAGALTLKASQTGNLNFANSAGAAFDKGNYQIERATTALGALQDAYGFDCTVAP